MGESMIEIIGIYKIKAKEPVYLIEAIVENNNGLFEIGKITQEVAGQPKNNWQVPYEEMILDEKGEKITFDSEKDYSNKELWKGNIRFTFFFHYLDISKPLITQWGQIQIPKPIALPKRLKIIKYSQPD